MSASSHEKKMCQNSSPLLTPYQVLPEIPTIIGLSQTFYETEILVMK